MNYENMQELAKACTQFYRSLEQKGDFLEKRLQLSTWIRKFHEDCGTLTSNVEAAINKLKDGSCIFLMTAHQPNLFAYSGVLRKATLSYVLSKQLSRKLSRPVVGFFGIADQDFTDDRWVKSSLIPDVERRNGSLELRIELPEKLMLNRVQKPSAELLDRWRNQIKNWLNLKTHMIKRLCEGFKIGIDLENANLLDNFELFWRIVEDAYEKAENYSDFNAFLMSKIINEVWGYDTLFCRFSQCQQIFEKEFSFLLMNFTKYSRYVKEATQLEDNTLERGVYEYEYKTIPFWYYCDCGSKVRLLADLQKDSLVGCGQCLNCREEYKISLLSKGQPEISGILSRISARSLSMPLVFSSGLYSCCYVGGVGGVSYLKQARYVAEHMGILFPPIVVWRPHDVYLGIGQLEAILTFRKLSGTFNFSEYSTAITKLRGRATKIKREIEKLELQKKMLIRHFSMPKEEVVEKMKGISIRQNKIRRETSFSVLARKIKLLENVRQVMLLRPSIIDYAVNVGLESTSKQWIDFLKEEGSLTSNIYPKTDFDKVFPHIKKDYTW